MFAKQVNQCGAVALMAVLTQSCSMVQPPPDLEGGHLKESLATQKRINRYFHSVVVPELKTCWERVQGKGMIEMKYLYEHDSKGAWAFKKVEVGKSNLPEGQDAIALSCVRKAVTATSFPRESLDSGESYCIHWSWPVPLPQDTAQRAERMFRDNGGAGGTGGCDGRGTPPSCARCSQTAPDCLTVCVGFPSCTITPTPGGGVSSC